MYKLNPNILQTPIENGCILLLEPSRGLYFELNETSVVIFNGLVDKLDTNQLVATILDNYHTNEQQALSDIKKLIEKLVDNNIIEICT